MFKTNSLPHQKVCLTISILLAIFFVLLYFWLTPPVSQAITGNNPNLVLNGADFQPGRIIDDHIFTNSSTMSIEEIQRFLETTLPTGQCDRYKQSPYSNQISPPYTCLFEFQQNPLTGVHNYGLFTDDGAPASVDGGQSAAEIIWNAAQTYSINPQVLLVLLQKEQSLITDTWPFPRQFSAATGYACPDTAPCDPQSASFYRQISGAAWQFRHYLDNLDSYWYIVGENNILYHPYHACGYQTVDIQNKATVALYLYTPYVPNQAALDNLFGLGDNCSSYGNRNFWTYFNRWFGPTISGQINAPPSVAPTNLWDFQRTEQALYADSSYEDLLGEYDSYIQPGQTAHLVFSLQNNGSATWTKDSGENQVILIPDASTAAGLFCTPSWPSCQQAAQLQEESVAFQETGTFAFEITAPLTEEQLLLKFQLSNNGLLVQGDDLQIILAVTGPAAVMPPVARINPPASPPPPADDSDATPPQPTPSPSNPTDC